MSQRDTYARYGYDRLPSTATASTSSEAGASELSRPISNARRAAGRHVPGLYQRFLKPVIDAVGSVIVTLLSAPLTGALPWSSSPPSDGQSSSSSSERACTAKRSLCTSSEPCCRIGGWCGVPSSLPTDAAVTRRSTIRASLPSASSSAGGAGTSFHSSRTRCSGR